MDRVKLEQQLAQLPICQYEFITSDELTFSEQVRYICRTECPMYGKSWSCPPAVGSVEHCQAVCHSYPHGLLFTTMAEVSDIANLDETLSTRREHEEITHQVANLLRQQEQEVYGLSTESCCICEKCSYPDAPCRHPERMFPCIESHGILVTALAEKYDISFLSDYHTVTWFSILLYRPSKTADRKSENNGNCARS